MTFIEKKAIGMPEKRSWLRMIENASGYVAPLVVGYENLPFRAQAQPVRFAASRVERNILPVLGNLEEPSSPGNVSVAAPPRLEGLVEWEIAQAESSVEAAFLIANETKSVLVVIASVSPTTSKKFKLLNFN